MELNRAPGVFDIKRVASRLDQGVPPTALLSIDDESAMPPHGALAVSAVTGRRLEPASSDDSRGRVLQD